MWINNHDEDSEFDDPEEEKQQLALTPQECDALVAEKVFGRKVYRRDTWGHWLLYHETKPGILESIPRYSESMDTAHLIVKRMNEQDMEELRSPFASYLKVTFATSDDFDTFEMNLRQWAEMTPRKICEAALLTIAREEVLRIAKEKQKI